MCKEMPVIPVDRTVDPKRIIGKKWRAGEEERHKGSLIQKRAKVVICDTRFWVGRQKFLFYHLTEVAYLEMCTKTRFVTPKELVQVGHKEMSFKT
jgi:hypothetical protein